MATHIGNPASTYYAKPVLETAPATWGSDVITPTTVANFPGRFEFAFTAGTDYIVYEQAGESPASTDEAIATWGPQVALESTLEAGIVTLQQDIAGIEGGSGGATAEEIAQELEREGGVLSTILGKFLGIDLLAKWLRK